MPPVIDWTTPLVALGPDASPYATSLRDRLTTSGNEYDSYGRPSVLDESTAHSQWRSAYSTQLAQLDRAAATVDGLPPTSIDPTDPKAATAAVMNRVDAAIATADAATATFLTNLRASGLPPEPMLYVAVVLHAASANVVVPTTGTALGLELTGAIDETNRYLAIR